MSNETNAAWVETKTPVLSKPKSTIQSYLLADFHEIGLVEVELVDYPVALDQTRKEILIADSECEV